MDIKNKVYANNEHIDKKKIESLLNILTTTYLGRRKSLSVEKLDELKQQFIKLIERGKDTVPSATYERMLRIVDRFDTLLKLPGIMDKIKYGNINSKHFLEMYRRAIMGNERTKYDMSDLYSAKAIAFKPNTYLPNENLRLSLNNDFTKTFVTRDGRIILITPVGELDYQSGIMVLHDYLTLFKVTQERESKSGKFDTDFVYSKFNLHELEENEELRHAIIDDLLDRDNIDKANCGGYVGEVCKQTKTDEDDVIHSEKIDRTEYTYRLSDNYVLTYDETSVSAAINMPTSKVDFKQHTDKGKNSEQNSNSSSLKSPDEKIDSKKQTKPNKNIRHIYLPEKGRHFVIKNTKLKGKHFRNRNGESNKRMNEEVER